MINNTKIINTWSSEVVIHLRIGTIEILTCHHSFSLYGSLRWTEFWPFDQLFNFCLILQKLIIMRKEKNIFSRNHTG